MKFLKDFAKFAIVTGLCMGVLTSCATKSAPPDPVVLNSQLPMPAVVTFDVPGLSNPAVYRIIDQQAGVVCYITYQAMDCMPASVTNLDVK